MITNIIKNEITTPEEHDLALVHIEQLFDKCDFESDEFITLAAHIRAYEDTAPEYAEFNACVAAMPYELAVERMADQRIFVLEPDAYDQFVEPMEDKAPLNGLLTRTPSWEK